MHDHRKTAGEGNTGLLEASALGELHSPCLQGEGLPASGEDRVGRFVEQLAHRAIALFGEASAPRTQYNLVLGDDRMMSLKFLSVSGLAVAWLVTCPPLVPSI
jgi:hypothetical protein